MLATYRLNSNELDDVTLKSIFNTFKGKNIEIIIKEIEDETEYLSKNPVNNKHLLDAIENVKNKTNLVEVKFDDLQ